ncbi:hypothetical protein GGS20DRAFT_371350 [Poronia punctata]|nr:hypothetical protein GGS20DRAFT_371350 [Poronia punctata]
MTDNKSPVCLDIIVVGAGLSGLATAISSALSGHKVTVYEAANQLQEFGAGLQITPNSSRLLQKWNLPEETFWKTVAEPTYIAVHRYSDGKILALEEDFHTKMRSRYGSPFVDVHRVDLHSALATRAKELGVKIELGQKVTRVDSITPSIETEKGVTAKKADLIVAADGIWSTCRNQFLDIKDFPRPTGDLAYRIVLTLDEIDDPELRDIVRKPASKFWIGPDSHVVAYSVRGGTMYNIVLIIPDDLPEGVRRQPGSVEQMRALFKGWDPILTRFLGFVKSVDKWRLMHRRELRSWVNEQGNCVFVGDSCHPMLPYLAQGANSAIEDGAVLGLLLGRIQTRQHLPKALRMYQTLRKARGDAIVKETFKQRDSFQMRNGPAQEARDELFLSQLGTEVKAPFPSRWTCPQVQSWLYGYDAYKEVEEAVKKDPFV